MPQFNILKLFYISPLNNKKIINSPQHNHRFKNNHQKLHNHLEPTACTFNKWGGFLSATCLAIFHGGPPGAAAERRRPLQQFVGASLSLSLTCSSIRACSPARGNTLLPTSQEQADARLIFHRAVIAVAASITPEIESPKTSAADDDERKMLLLGLFSLTHSLSLTS